MNAQPKPIPKKHKSKHQTNPHPPFGATCWVCGRSSGLQTHECFGSSNRNLSIKYELQVYLCNEDHLGTNGVHGKNGKPLADRLHRLGQTTFEMFSGTRDEFMTIFKIGNYLGGTP